VNEEIKIEEWKEFFMESLGGVEGKVIRGKAKRKKDQEESVLEREEIRNAIKKLKDKKATGGDTMIYNQMRYNQMKHGRMVETR